jgi:hypothetical protein
MKKIIFLFSIAFGVNASSYASNLVQKERDAGPVALNMKKEPLSRQCCEQSATDANGNIVTIEACAGWFLSDDINAHDKACDKARAALGSIVGYDVI